MSVPEYILFYSVPGTTHVMKVIKPCGPNMENTSSFSIWLRRLLTGLSRRVATNVIFSNDSTAPAQYF